MKVATQTAATDPRTGTIDMDMITTGQSTGDRVALARLAAELKALLTATMAGQRVHLADLRRKVRARRALERVARIEQGLFVQRARMCAGGLSRLCSFSPAEHSPSSALRLRWRSRAAWRWTCRSCGPRSSSSRRRKSSCTSSAPRPSSFAGCNLHVMWCGFGWASSHGFE